jgi:hypothetical protein
VNKYIVIAMTYRAKYVKKLFDADNSITRASGRGLGPGNRDFLGFVKGHKAVRGVSFGAQKSRDVKTVVNCVNLLCAIQLPLQLSCFATMDNLMGR